MIEVRIDTYASKLDPDSEWEKLYVVTHTCEDENFLKKHQKQSAFKFLQYAVEYADNICMDLQSMGRREVTNTDTFFSQALVRYLANN